MKGRCSCTCCSWRFVYVQWARTKPVSHNFSHTITNVVLKTFFQTKPTYLCLATGVVDDLAVKVCKVSDIVVGDGWACWNLRDAATVIVESTVNGQ